MMASGEMTTLFIASGEPGPHPQRIAFMSGWRDRASDLSTTL
jgi:hypothetical protein